MATRSGTKSSRSSTSRTGSSRGGSTSSRSSSGRGSRSTSMGSSGRDYDMMNQSEDWENEPRRGASSYSSMSEDDYGSRENRGSSRSEEHTSELQSH